MKYYLVEEEGNYCGYDDEYIIETDKDYNTVDDYACTRADDRTTNYEDDEDDEDEELHISCFVEEISKEDFDKHKANGYEVVKL